MAKLQESVIFDDLVNALADVQRRKLLITLLEHDPQTNPPVVIDQSVSDATTQYNHVTMEHVHLPKLVEYGFITWDRDTHEVAKGPHFAEIEPLLSLLREHEHELPQGWL